MRYWPLLSLIPALAFGFFLGTHSWNSKRTVKTFVDMRLPADAESDFIVNMSQEIDAENIGKDNFLFNASLLQNESAWGIQSKTFFKEIEGELVDICDYVNSLGGYVTYSFEAEGVANSGDKIEIKINRECSGFDFVELFPFNFCRPEFDSFNDQEISIGDGNYEFVNFSDFMPKIWFLKSVEFVFGLNDQGDLESDKVVANPSDPILISCFEN